MSFQVHSELVKVAELTLLALKHHLFSEMGNSGFPSSPPLPCWLLRVSSAWQTQMCLRDRGVELTTGEQGSWLWAQPAAPVSMTSPAQEWLQPAWHHSTAQTSCRTAAVWVAVARLPSAWPPGSGHTHCLSRPPSLILMISDLQAVGSPCKECQMEPAGSGAMCCLYSLLSEQQQSFPWN